MFGDGVNKQYISQEYLLYKPGRGQIAVGRGGIRGGDGAVVCCRMVVEAVGNRRPGLREYRARVDMVTIVIARDNEGKHYIRCVG